MSLRVINYLGDAAVVVYSKKIDRDNSGLNLMKSGCLGAWVKVKGEVLRLVLNGETIETELGVTVAAILSRLDLEGGRVAVAVNGELSPRGEHARRLLQDGDTVEVIHAVAGG